MLLVDQLKDKEMFTYTELKVIDYILEHSEQFEDLTINELAGNSFSSNATIIRICRKLGFEGYRDFKIAYLKERESQKYVTNNVDFSLPFYQNASSASIINSMSSLYKESIDLINSQLDIKTLDQVVSAILSSKRLFVFAVGDTRITAMNFINKMIKINYYPVLATDHHEELAFCHNMTSEHCALFISYSGHNSTYEDCLKILKGKRCTILSISANERSLIMKAGDYKISIPDKEEDDKIATFYSQFAFQYILNIIYSLIYKVDFQKNHSHKQIIDLQHAANKETDLKSR